MLILNFSLLIVYWLHIAVLHKLLKCYFFHWLLISSRYLFPIGCIKAFIPKYLEQKGSNSKIVQADLTDWMSVLPVNSTWSTLQLEFE